MKWQEMNPDFMQESKMGKPFFIFYCYLCQGGWDPRENPRACTRENSPFKWEGNTHMQEESTHKWDGKAFLR